MRKLFEIIVLMKEIWGMIINYPILKFWRIHYKTLPHIRGRLFIRNYGEIRIGRAVRINSNLDSSQLGFYPKTILHTSRSGQIIIGDNSGLSNVTLNSRESIIIGNDVRLGAGVKIYDNDFHQLVEPISGSTPEVIPSSPVIVEDNVFIGAGSIILKGVNIGEGAIIGAGSVVAKSVPHGEIWAGNPARKIK